MITLNQVDSAYDSLTDDEWREHRRDSRELLSLYQFSSIEKKLVAEKFFLIGWCLASEHYKAIMRNNERIEDERMEGCE